MTYENFLPRRIFVRAQPLVYETGHLRNIIKIKLETVDLKRYLNLTHLHLPHQLLHLDTVDLSLFVLKDAEMSVT